MKARFMVAWVAGVSAAALVSTGSLAQAVPAAPAAATKEGDDSTIIVTATRRNERLQDVPAQVSSVSGTMLQSLQTRSLVDFAALTPGLSFQATTPNSSLLVVRGVTTGTQLSSAVGVYLDDVPIGSSTPFGAGAESINLDTFDLQRVEVLNGPQGTLFGSNSLGGAVRYMSQAPQLGVLSGRIEGEGGYTEHGTGDVAARAVINLPLGDKVALRIEGVDQHEAGWASDPDHNRYNQGSAFTLQGRATLLYRPTSDLSFSLSADGNRITSNGLAVVFRDITTHQPTEGLYDQSYASAQPSEVSFQMYKGVIDWNLHWAKLTSITAYQLIKNTSIADDAQVYSAILSPIFGPAGNEPYTVPAQNRTSRFTQEVRFASASNHTFEWVVGGFYSHENTHQSIGVVNTADPDGALFGTPLGLFELPSTADEYAVFGNATLYLARTLDVTAGLRESWDNQVFTSSGSGLLIDPVAPYTTITSTGTSKLSTTTYLFNLRYRPTSATTLYARAASGYRPGGPNLITATNTTPTFASDSLWNYEVGIKQAFAKGRGAFNASLYRIDWSNIQQVISVGGVNQFVNAGNARVNGVEASATYRIVPAFNLMASGSYTDARLRDPAPILGVDYSGARLPVSPRFSAAITGIYSFQVNNGLTGDVAIAYHYIGNRNAGYADSAVQPLYQLAGYNTVDLTATLRTRDGWEISPYIKNLFDVRGEVTASATANEFLPTAPVPVTLSRPRTFGAVIARAF